MLRGVLLAATLLFFATSARAELGRDDQWTYVLANADHGARAEFRGDTLDERAIDLMFQIECATSEPVLVFRYFVTTNVPVGPMALMVYAADPGARGHVFSMPARRVSDTLLESRLPLTNEVVGSIATGQYFEIGTPVAPDDMDEPFFAGGAPALRRVARECWATSVG